MAGQGWAAGTGATQEAVIDVDVDVDLDLDLDRRSGLMHGCGCDAGFEIFDRRTAAADLERYRQRGPDRSTSLLLDLIRSRGVVRGARVLDIGAGVGVIDHELLDEGAERAVLVDAATPALEVAQSEAERRGREDRMTFVGGDFVALAPTIDEADIVTLDRVVCCYPDMTSLVRLSAARARAVYGLVLPRDRAITRLGLAVLNQWFRLRGIAYRSYVHPNAAVDAVLAETGWRPAAEARTFVWRVVVYTRGSAAAMG
jgi:magnesium-protoporphyrin O-methyltransferase